MVRLRKLRIYDRDLGFDEGFGDQGREVGHDLFDLRAAAGETGDSGRAG